MRRGRFTAGKAMFACHTILAWVAVRLLLVLAALIALRFGLTRMQDWDNMRKATFHATWQDGSGGSCSSSSAGSSSRSPPDCHVVAVTGPGPLLVGTIRS
jgi:hypothetical protein